MPALALFVVALALVPLHGVFGAPPCTQDLHSCISKCKHKGWPGYVMGNRRWGNVVELSNKDIDDIVTRACGGNGTASGLPLSVPLSLPSGTSPSPIPQSSMISPVSSTPYASPAPDSAMNPTTSSAVPSNGIIGPVSNSDVPTSSPTSTPGPISSSIPKPTPSPTSSPAPSSTPASSTSSRGSGAVSSTDITAYLSAHNTLRAQHGAAPLTWSSQLSGLAQEWADKCVFQHSGGSLGPYGENLAAGTGLGITAAIGLWSAEASQYNPNDPQYSHFTQMVWKATTQVGCAVQACNGIIGEGQANFYVCEYNPPGNVIGEFAQNVQA